jgi:iron-sulfur cluster assembly accessory protein
MVQNQDSLNKSDDVYVNHKLLKPTKFIFYKDSDVRLTDDAVAKINQLRNNDEKAIVRIVISGGGCQGFQYEFTNDAIENIGIKSRDIVLVGDNKNTLIVFDLFSEFYIKGAKINYISNIIESGFKIEDNPKAKASCGCKKSFSSDEYFEGDDE